MEKAPTESGRTNASDTESARARKVEAEINDSPVEQVRLTVPITDDPTIPVLTFRAWMMGFVCGFIQASSTGIAIFRRVPVTIPIVIWQLSTLPLGRFLARVLPTRRFTIPCTKLNFTLNPGPFSVKEHCIISLMVDAGHLGPQLTSYMVIMKIYYGLKVNTRIALIMNSGVQMMGVGIAGLFTKLVVDNPRMWWPSTLISVVMYRTLHKAEKRRKGSVTRLQYLCICSLAVFVYGMIPGFLFPMLTAVSVLCLIYKKSVFAQQLGAGQSGFGIGSFTLNLETVSFSSIDPFVMPLFAINNLMFGFVIFLYVLVPIYYFNNYNLAKRFPLASEKVFDKYGQLYNDTMAMGDDFTFNQQRYESYSKLYLSSFQAVGVIFTFACLTASILHVLIYHGKEMYHGVLEVYGYQMKTDVHGRLMRRYKRIPVSWYYLLIAATLIATLITSHIGINEHMRLPPLYIILATMLSVVLTLPDMVLVASTGQGIPQGILTEMVIGYLNRGHTLQNMLLRNFFAEVPTRILEYCMWLKFTHYMKIPPRDVFIARVSMSLIATVANMGFAWRLILSIPNICEQEKLPPGSPWTCPLVIMMASNSTIWGLIGPKEVFFPHGVYRHVGWGMPIGIIAVFLHWLLTLRFPRSKFLHSIYLPTIFAGANNVPPTGPVNWWSAYLLGVINTGYLYRYHKRWWTRYNYLTASAVGIGTSLVVYFISLTFHRYQIYGPDWWGLTNMDHCPLSRCPTDPNVEAPPICRAGL